jgi:hypothetical protein
VILSFLVTNTTYQNSCSHFGESGVADPPFPIKSFTPKVRPLRQWLTSFKQLSKQTGGKRCSDKAQYLLQRLGNLWIGDCYE